MTTRARGPEIVVAALAIAAMATWVSALLTSMPPPAPVLVVQSERALPTTAADAAGAPWALRFVAVAPGGSAPLDVTGTVELNGARANIAYNTARIDNATPGRATFDVVTNPGGVRAHGVVDIAPLARVDDRILWRPWYGEVAMRNLARAPVYPLDGRVSARLPSSVALVDVGPHNEWTGTTRVEHIAPSVSGARLADGRVLQVDRSGLRVDVELQPTGDVVAVHISASEPRTVACDLLVDGVVRDAQNVNVVPTVIGGKTDPTTGEQFAPTPATAQEPAAMASVSMRMGPTRPDAFAVVHCGGVYDSDVGRLGFARAHPDPARTQAQWLREIARKAAVPDDDPLLALDDNALSQAEVVRAALGRLAPSKVRAPRLDVVWTVDTGPAATLRMVYFGLAIVVVVATLALGLLRMPQRRGAVLAGVVALAAVLGGLGAALVVIGS